MNCNQAKQIKIEDFLNNQGIQPAKIYGRFLWYKAPYREDSNPSFKVNTNKNVWYDISTGAGGNIIDLVILMHGTDLAGALNILEKPNQLVSTFSFSNKQEENKSGIEIRHVQELQNRALIQYLNKRMVSHLVASKFVQEAYYTVKGKQFFAVAFQNDKGGYELRNEYFKGGNSPKYITTIPGANNSLNIFEGFIDFLSAITYFRLKQPGNTTIILNTLSSLPYIENSIKSANRVNCYLDNDEPGKTAFCKIAEMNPNVFNQAASLYPGYKDFNEFVCNTWSHGT